MSVYRLLEKTPALSGADPALLQRMADAATTRNYARGDYLWHAGDLARNLTLIRTGLVKLVRSAPRGRTAICGLFGPSETLGDLVVIKGIPYPVDAMVATDAASVVQVPASLVVDSMKRSSELACSIACAMHKKLAALHDKIDVMSAGAVEARLATLMLKLYDQFGDDAEDGGSFVPINLSRRELSDLVGTAFETAIRVMTRWERENVLVTRSSGFVIRSLETLEEIAGVTTSGRRAAE
jgi:CRP/FNR family transcriptional regulator